MHRVGGLMFRPTHATVTNGFFSNHDIDFAIKLLRHSGTDWKVEQPLLRGLGLKTR